VYGTGQNNDFTLATQGTTDQHYTIISSPSSSTPKLPFVAQSFPGIYIHDRSDSQWLGPEPIISENDAAGKWYYETSFSLAGLDPSTAILNGVVAADNSVTIFLNGVATPFACTVDTCFEFLTPFSLTGPFVACTNTLGFLVNNEGEYTALLVGINGTANPASIPYPCSSPSCPSSPPASTSSSSPPPPPPVSLTTGSALTPQQVCANANQADWGPNGIGYYCNGQSQFIECVVNFGMSSSYLFACPAGTACICGTEVECSARGTEAPCAFNTFI